MNFLSFNDVYYAPCSILAHYIGSYFTAGHSWAAYNLQFLTFCKSYYIDVYVNVIKLIKKNEFFYEKSFMCEELNFSPPEKNNI